MGRVAGNAFVNGIALEARALRRPRQDSALANRQRQTVTRVGEGMGAGGTRDIAIAAEDLVVEEQLAQLDLEGTGLTVVVEVAVLDRLGQGFLVGPSFLAGKWVK